VNRWAFAAITACCLAGPTVPAEMTADRPGFSNSPNLVGQGIVQVENGFGVSGDHSVAIQPGIRIGALRWMEIRLLADNVVLRSAPGTGVAGTSDLEAGIKFAVLNGLKRTRAAAIVKSTVPSGHHSQTSAGYEPGAELIWEHELTDDFSFGGTWNLTRLKQEQFVWQRAASVSADYSFGSRWESFGEVYVVSPSDGGGSNQWTADAGITRLIGDFLMLDATAGHTIHGQNDWFVQFGFSLRSRIRHLMRPTR
jgi:hypothetical protein